MSGRGQIPTETLIILHNQMQELSTRDPRRRALVKEVAELYGVSLSTVYHSLKHQTALRTVKRADYNQPRVTPLLQMEHYCKIISAIQFKTSNKKGRHLSVKNCIKLLEEYGIETPDGLVKAPKGLLKVSTVHRHLQRLGYLQGIFNIEPGITRFQAIYSNDCWQFDFSRSDLKHLKYPPANASKNAVLMLASVVDDRSGVAYQEYHYVEGEDVMTALRFLFNAMSKKTTLKCPLQGIPKMIYTDNGPIAKSLVFKRVMAYLGIEVKTHMPKNSDGRRTTSRAKGKVERNFLSIKSGLETLYHFHPPESLEESNQFLRYYLEQYQEMPHRSEPHSRAEDWLKNLPPEGFREMCTWDRFRTFAREPETRKVGKDACVSVGGVSWQVAVELAGQEVTLFWGMYDNELYIDYHDQHYGPFYPAQGPIPLHTYRRAKKSKTEERADSVTELAKHLSISKAALTGEMTDPLLSQMVTPETTPQPSIPFQDPDPFHALMFKSTLEAKLAIASWLGYPLARLNPDQLLHINQFLSTTLEKVEVMNHMREYFSLRLVKQCEE